MTRRLIFLCAALTIFWMIGASRGVASDAKINTDSITITSWSLLIEARMSGLHDSSTTLGVRPDATPDYDSQYDRPSPPNPPGDWLQVYFPHTGGHWPTLLGTKFSTDITSPDSAKWFMNLESSLDTGFITLSWDTTMINELPVGYEIIMKDSTSGDSIKLRHQPSYAFHYSGLRYFSIWVSYNLLFDSVVSGWNLVSVPQIVEDSSKITLFPNSISSAFSYEGSYVIRATLDYGKGYWLKFNSPQVIKFAGSALPTFNVPVAKGWNLIGSVDHNVPAPTGGIIASSFFGYRGSYFVVDTLRAGKGYWVKASTAGSISVGNGYLLSKSFVPGRLPDKKISVTITDNSQSKQTLYLLPATAEASLLTLSEMPPQPIDGGFDARFISQRFIETYQVKNAESNNFTIQVQSSNYPIVLAAEIHDSNVLRGECSFDGRTWHRFPVRIEDPQVQSVRIRIVTSPMQPKNFMLNQNYPNPFNPSTTIRYTLPEQTNLRIVLSNVLGKEIAVMAEGVEEAGFHDVVIDANVLNLASGVYFYRLVGTGILSHQIFEDTKKLLLVK